jgi:hypothetical protein
MTEIYGEKTANAWLLVDLARQGSELGCPQFAIELSGSWKLYSAVAEGDWVAVAAVREL